MVYLINGYSIIEYDSAEEAERAAEEKVKAHGLSYEKVFVGTKEYRSKQGDGDFEDGEAIGFMVKTIVYQYHTLYFETFVITPELNVFNHARLERISKEEKKND